MLKRKVALFLLGVAASAAGACSSAELTPASGPGSSGAPGDPVDGGDPTEAGPRNPSQDLDGGTLPVSKNVTIQVIPSDKAAAVLAAVKGATKSVHMTMYILTDDRFTNALSDLKTAGKDVKVLLNQTFPDGNNLNTSAFNTLKAKGVDVKWAPAGYAYTHSKSIIIDANKLIVMTMNLTDSSPTTNREFIATDLDPDDVAVAETIFAADAANKSSTVATKLLLSPQSATTIDARQRLLALIDGATKTLEIAGESLSDPKIVDAIVSAEKAGVAVKVVIDQKTGTPAQQEAVAKLKAAGVPIVAIGKPDMHAKAIVADGKQVYVGSMNFTANSLNSNRELGLITDVPSEVAKVQTTIAADFAAGTAL